MENKISILHLEDQEADSILVKSLISKWFDSFDYYFADDEASFVKLLKEKKVDVILSDYELPDYSGSDALLLVKKQYPQIPFIFVTGKMGEDSAIESLLNGATDYVLKSKLERLVPAINRVVYEAKLLKDRIDADNLLRESEEKYRKLVENISDVIFELNSNWEIIYISPVIEKIIGYKPAELIGNHFLTFVYMPHQALLTQRLSELIHSTEIAHEFRFVPKTKDICWVRASIKARVADGKFMGGNGTLIDITRRKQDEDALAKEQYLMETLMNIIPDHLYFKDLESKFIRVSKSLVPSFNLLEPSEAIGKTDFDFFTEEHAREAFLDEQEIIRTGITSVKEEKETWADRPETWVYSTKLPLRDKEGNIVGIFGISRDITERKRFEEELLKAKEMAEASDRLKTAFMRNISHEIRTPLSGILGFGQLLSEPDLTPEEKEEFLIMVKESSDRLINTVTNIMDASLLVSGNLELQKKQFAPGRLLTQLYSQFNPRCIQKKLSLSLQKNLIGDDFFIDSDPDRLNKVLCHLIDNAVKFTKVGTIEFGGTLNEKEIEFFVKDTGIGLTPDDQKSIFDHFMQGDNSESRVQEGSGLGLSISKGLVELLGGRIWVESVKGEGCSFFFTIPIGPADQEITENKQSVVCQTEKPLILIADDEEGNRLLLERVLHRAGFYLIVATNGQQAVEACRQNSFITLVLMDIKMPVMDGLEATKIIKSFRPDLPVIALTGFALSGDEKRALDSGCNDYITKPLIKDVLMNKLSQYGAMAPLGTQPEKKSNDHHD